MFLANKYRLWYFQIIENSKSRVLRSGTERHHIIPKCFGGSNDPENIALLTYREHFLAHWLLPKFTGGKLRYKMLSALWQMARVPKHYTRMTASWQYEVARAAVAEVTKARSIGNKYGVGRKWTAIEHERHQCMLQQRRETPTPKEWREKISQGKRGIKASQETKMKMSASRIGKKHTEETKRKMSLASAGRPKTSVMREKLRQHKLGKKLSLETRRRNECGASSATQHECNPNHGRNIK